MRTDNMLSSIKNFNSNKSLGLDDLSIKMVKLCSRYVAYSIKPTFEAPLLEGKFPECWKRANVVPVHTKEKKNLVKNYKPISLLTTENFFERVIFKDCLTTSIVHFLSASLLFYQATLAFYSHYLLIMISTLHLPVILHRMSGEYFWILPKLLIKSGMRGYCIN